MDKIKLLNQLKDFYNVVKVTKAEVVCVSEDGQVIYGTDKERAILYKISVPAVPQYLRGTLFYLGNLNNVLKYSDPNNVSVQVTESILKGQNIISLRLGMITCVIKPYAIHKDYSDFIRLFDKETLLQRYPNNIQTITNFEQTEEYSKFKELSATDGIVILDLFDAQITMHAGLINANKSDSVKLEFLNLDTFFVVRFTIYKPKGVQVEVMVSYYKM